MLSPRRSQTVFHQRVGGRGDGPGRILRVSPSIGVHRGSLASDDAHPPQRLAPDRDVMALHEGEGAIAADAEHGEIGGNRGRRAAVADRHGALIADNEQATRRIEGEGPRRETARVDVWMSEGSPVASSILNTAICSDGRPLAYPGCRHRRTVRSGVRARCSWSALVRSRLRLTVCSR